MSTKTSLIRNFSIIAHIDHGKSTLADQFLLKTGTISQRDFQNQLLDSMDLERERGITIRMHPVTIYYTYKGREGEAPAEPLKGQVLAGSAARQEPRPPVPSVQYELNLIDTPGHVDFGYEVSRSLAACEGVILLVDASQGIEAQTLANCYQALEHDLTIVAALNKIDLPAAEPEKRAEEIERVLGIPKSEILHISAKTGEGVPALLDAVID